MAASAAVFIGFGQPVRGRERQAVQVFDEAVQYYTRLQQQGDIESFEAALLEPHGGDLGGFVLIRGDRDKLDKFRASQEFARLNTRAATVVQNLGVVNAAIGDELNRQFASYESDIADLIR
jgi:hypothetical protein